MSALPPAAMAVMAGPVLALLVDPGIGPDEALHVTWGSEWQRRRKPGMARPAARHALT